MSENAPKPRVEVQQESTERLEVLELDRTPRPEKMARETAMLAGATEVAYQERAFRPRHPADVAYVRERVDALEVQRRTLPDLPAPPALPTPPPKPVVERHRRALEPHLPGPLVAVEAIFASDAGEVVAAYWDEDGERRSREFLLKDGVATPVEDVAARVDALPAPTVATPPPAPAPAAPEPAKEDGKKKRGLGFGRKKEAAGPEAPTETPPPEEPKKRRFGFGKRGA